MYDFFQVTIYANLLPFVSLIFFLFFVLNNPVFDKKQTKYFLLTGSITLCMIIVVSIDFIIDRSLYLNLEFENIYILRRITTFLNFAVNPLLPMLVYNIYASQKIRFAVYFPAIANVILCFISIFTGWIFYIAEGNFYNRGDLFILPFLTTVFYLAMLIIQPGHIYTKSKRAERLFIMIVVFVLSACMYLEVIHYFVFLTWDFTSLCLILYYLLLNIHRTIIDPLTGAYNRLAHMKELELINHQTSSVLALVDINNFKDINDQFGHDAGDKYLQEFTLLLEHAFSSIGKVYRIGGDEFMVIAKKISEAKFQECLSHAEKLSKEKSMRFACGWKMYTPDQSIEEFQIEIDQLMYEHKHKIKVMKEEV